MTDLLKRLWDDDRASALTNEAARKIEALLAENEKLRAALNPFADDADAQEGS